jgi:hypothetical protein
MTVPDHEAIFCEVMVQRKREHKKAISRHARYFRPVFPVTSSLSQVDDLLRDACATPFGRAIGAGHRRASPWRPLKAKEMPRRHVTIGGFGL